MMDPLFNPSAERWLLASCFSYGVACGAVAQRLFTPFF